MRLVIPALLTAALLAGCAASPGPSYSDLGSQASIPFADAGNIRDWKAVSNRVVYLQATNQQWYRADLMNSCFSLRGAEHIGVASDATGHLDRFGTLIVDGQRCQIASLVQAAPPV